MRLMFVCKSLMCSPITNPFSQQKQDRMGEEGEEGGGYKE